jgi:intein/homing endonuclease
LSWRKYFTSANRSGLLSPISGESPGATGSKANYSSYLPDVYTGSPNRIERYLQYDTMDMDSEVNAALDILSEFSTQLNTDNGTPFFIEFMDKASSVEVKLLRDYLQKWCKLQHFETRMFRIFRNTIKYGDSFFIRDPETKKWFYIDPGKVVKIIVNESEGKKPEQYVIRDINPNFTHMVVTQINPSNQNTQPGGTAYVTGGAGARGMTGAYPQQSGTRYSIAQNEFAIEAHHVVHLSLSEGLDNNYPFGNSLLESVFKVYKQKELLEDAIIIYRVQRAPERRVFYIDVGNMPSHMAMQFVERVKNEIHQRRIPSSTGGSQSVVDAGYNPLCLDLSTKIPLLDGRTLKLSEIISEFEHGKENWAYSCNPETGEVVPGVITWAGITRKNAEVIQLTFDNGNTLICTPDHKIPVFGKGFVEAKDIQPTDSLIAFNRQNKKISSRSSEYEQVWDHSKKSWIWTHRMVGEFFRKINKHQEFTYLPENIGREKSVIHHKDRNRFNNDPRNLQYMNREDHILFHSVQKKDFWENITLEKNKKICINFFNFIKEKIKTFFNKTDQFNHKVAKIETLSSRDTGTITIDGSKRWHDFHTFAIDSGIFIKNSINEDFYFPQTCISLDTKIKLLDNRDLTLQEIINEYENGKINYAYTVNQQTHTIEPGKIVWAGVTRKNAEVVEVTLDNGESVIVTPDHRFIMRDGSEKEAGLLESGDKIMSLDTTITIENVKILSERIDTGDITIESASGSHNFALSVGIFVHNSEGRGSKVDTLPGGTNLGEIDDLRYFTNKLFRALRIPSSYLPTGPDDSASQFNDGRVGTAYIQELRFNKYCQRLQRLIEEEFNVEFKLYLEQNGIIIDSSIFNIRFNPPQNFAAYRLSELDTVRVQTFNSIQEIPYFSKRFLMKRMLGFNEEEIVENERLWREENREIGDISPGSQAEMRGMGITASGIQSDLGGGDITGMEAGAESGEPGAEAGAAPIPATPAPTPPAPQ